MKKALFFLTLVTLFCFTKTIYAAKKEAGVKNQNQIQTQNQGEDTQIKVDTEEQEKKGTNSGASQETVRNQNAVQNMSQVASQVQKLLELNTTEGIGEQVRLVAREQNQTQTQIKKDLEKMTSRSGLLKKIIGPDYKALKSVQAQMEKNELRIRQLEQLKNKLNNQEADSVIEEMIQTLEKQNLSLKEEIALEEKNGGLFGWLFKLFE